MDIKLNIKKLSEDAIIPTRNNDYAAGYELYADLKGKESVIIPPHQTVKIGTGVAVAIPTGYWGGIYARSGIASKRNLRPANCTGVIDSDYRGEIVVALHNDSSEERVIEHKERIAQFIIHESFNVSFHNVNELDSTERGENGFGSSGRK